MDLKKLSKEISYKWKVQTTNGAMCQCVAFIDARDVYKILDNVVGPENWQTDFKMVNSYLMGGVGIYINNQWIWKWDHGTESAMDKEKGQISDSIKRAAVQWGIGRFLYDLKIQKVKKVDYKGKGKPADNSGNILWDNKALTDFINTGASKSNSNTSTTQTGSQTQQTTKTSYSKSKEPSMELRKETHAALVKLSGGNAQKAKELLKSFTSYEKDPQGKEALVQIKSEKQMQVVLSKINNVLSLQGEGN